MGRRKASIPDLWSGINPSRNQQRYAWERYSCSGCELYLPHRQWHESVIGVDQHIDIQLMKRRAFIQSAVATAVSAALDTPLSAHHAKGGVFFGQTFDFYISPTGSDSNAGTLLSPWAITSLQLISANAN